MTDRFRQASLTSGATHSHSVMPRRRSKSDSPSRQTRQTCAPCAIRGARARRCALRAATASSKRRA
eukprot:3009733-Alexandrium_andersonii.AAC.1